MREHYCRVLFTRNGLFLLRSVVQVDPSLSFLDLFYQRTVQPPPVELYIKACTHRLSSFLVIISTLISLHSLFFYFFIWLGKGGNALCTVTPKRRSVGLQTRLVTGPKALLDGMPCALRTEYPRSFL